MILFVVSGGGRGRGRRVQAEEHLGRACGGLGGLHVFALVVSAPRGFAIESIRPWPRPGWRSLEAVVCASS